MRGPRLSLAAPVCWPGGLAVPLLAAPRHNAILPEGATPTRATETWLLLSETRFETTKYAIFSPRTQAVVRLHLSPLAQDCESPVHLASDP